MSKNFVAKGDIMNFVAGGAIVSGQLVHLQHCLGVALSDGATGATIAVAVEGVFEVPKVAGAVYVQGEKLIFINATDNMDDSLATPASGDLTGAAIAMRAGLNGETTALIKLTPGNALRTP